MLKIVTLFLIGMAVLAMLGRLKMPDSVKRLFQRRDRSGLPKPRTCRTCGRVNLRGGDCPECRGDGDA